MAGETVLIVDDAPVNLKLTDILLRKEGYKVHTAADAEEALKLLRGFRPDLMLVDIQMPGMDGLELTRRLKRNPLTRDIVVVALTACAMKEDEQKALAAGCSGFITKPIDTHTLGNRVRQHLDGRDAAPSAPPDQKLRADGKGAAPERAGLSFSDAELEGLRRRFLEEGALQSRQMLECLDRNFDAPKTARLLHQWIGTAGVLGYPAISETARRVEELVLSEQSAERLHAALTDLVFAFSEPREAAQDPIPAFILDTLSGKAIAMVGFAVEEGERLCAALERAGARPRSFDLADLPGSGAVLDCGVLLFHVREETMGAWWINPGAKEPPHMPLVLVGRRAQILAVDRSVLARASEFLIDGWQPEEALMRLSFALSRGVPAAAPAPATAAARPGSGKAEILIADDDPVVISRVRMTLEEYGMKCMVASSGTVALQMVRDYRPHAVVLDVNMPGMDGFLVLAAIREQGLPVRVLLLSARRHENDISRAFNLGADDYMVKPFNQVELVARLKRLVRN